MAAVRCDSETDRMTNDLRETTGRRPIRRLRMAALVAALVCLSCVFLWPKLYSAKCDHADLMQHGVTQHRRDVDIERCSAAARSLLQLAKDRRLIGIDAASLKQQLAGANSVAVGHDMNFSPVSDTYTFNLPSIDPKFNFGKGVELCIAVSRKCGHVIDVTLYPTRVSF